MAAEDDGGSGARRRRRTRRQPFCQSVSLREKFTVAGFHRKRERSERARARARLLREKEEMNGLGRAGTDTILEEEA